MHNFINRDDNHSKKFNSEKKFYHTSHNGEYYGGDYDYYYYYYYYYDSDVDVDDVDDNDVDIDDIDDSDNGELVRYDKPFKDFKRLVYDEKNIIVSLINNDNYRHNIKLLVNDFNILICEDYIY